MFLRSRALLIYFSILVVYVGIRVAWFATTGTKGFSDSQEWGQIAVISQFSPSFYVGARPFVLPMFWRLVFQDFTFIVVGQLMISLFSWIALASVMYWLSHRWLKFPFMVTVLLLSLSWQVIIWDRALLSESIAISLMVLSSAGIATALHSKNMTALVATAFVISMWALTRDINAIVVIFLSIILAVSIGRMNRSVAGVAIAVALIGVVGIALSAIGDRGSRPLYHILVNRIAVDDNMMADMTEMGLPVSQLELAISSGVGGPYGVKYGTDADYDDLRTWIDDDGQVSYIRTLMQSPKHLFLGPLGDLSDMVIPSIDLYADPDATPIFGSKVGFLFSVPLVLVIFLASAASVIGGAIRGNATERRTIYWLVGGFLAAIVLHIYGVWHGDALELGRHSIGMAVQFQLTSIILLVIGSKVIINNSEV